MERKPLKNFVIDICGCRGDWTPSAFIDETVSQLKTKLTNDQVVLGLSGGVDSSVAAILLHKPSAKTCIAFLWITACCVKMNLIRFWIPTNTWDSILTGWTQRRNFTLRCRGCRNRNRKERQSAKHLLTYSTKSRTGSGCKVAGAGNHYPDVIESVSVKGPSATIKSHHNVGGLPER